MIDPAQTDIGRKVVWTEYLGGPQRLGVITSFSIDWVYVTYEGTAYAEPTPRENLEYLDDVEFRAR